MIKIILNNRDFNACSRSIASKLKYFLLIIPRDLQRGSLIEFYLVCEAKISAL